MYPKNSEEDVDAFLSRCGWRDFAERPVFLNIDYGERFLWLLSFSTYINVDDSWRFHRPPPHQTTIRSLLQSYLDINAIPRRSFFEVIQKFARDNLERDKLQDFGTVEGQVLHYPTRENEMILN